MKNTKRIIKKFFNFEKRTILILSILFVSAFLISQPIKKVRADKNPSNEEIKANDLKSHNESLKNKQSSKFDEPNKAQIDKGQLEEMRNNLQNNSDSSGKLLPQTLSPESSEKNPMTLGSVRISLLTNGNFESGHSNWTELYKSYDGNWYDWDLIISSASGGYDSWYAYLSERDWLRSSEMKLPINTIDLNLQYKYRLVHWGTCTYGTNGVGVYLNDNTTGEINLVSSHLPEFDPYDYDYVDTNTDLAISSSQTGHQFQLDYTAFNDDPSCSFALYVDNVSVTAETTDYLDTSTSTGIYRLYNTRSGAYLYTRGYADRNHVLNTWSNFEFTDGVPAFYASLAAQAGLTPIYRLYNTNNGAYLYTRGAADRDHVLNTWSNFEFTDGVPAFYASLTAQAGLTPIYRLYNTNSGMYLYTRGDADKAHVLNTWPEFEFTDGVPAFYASLTSI